MLPRTSHQLPRWSWSISVFTIFLSALVTHTAYAQPTYQPVSVWGMSSVFIEGESMFIHGGTTTTTSPPVGQTFAIDLSTNWTATQPAFRKLADGFSDYNFISALLSDSKTWFMVSNQTAQKYFTTNNTWVVVGSSGNVNPTKGLAAATNPSSGFVYVVDGWVSNGTTSMQEYNPANNQIDTVSTQPTLAGMAGFAAVWSTVRKSLLVHGGATVAGGTIQRALYEYVPGSGWNLLSDTGDVPPARKSHCMVPAYAGSKIIVFGGVDQTGAVLSDIYSLDTTTLIWTKGTDGGAAVARASSVCAVTNDLLVSWGGCDSKITALTAGVTVVYNMKRNAWQSTYTPTPDPALPITSPTAPSSSASTMNLGAIVGGAVGGVAVIALIVGAIFYKRRGTAHRHHLANSAENSDSEEGNRRWPLIRDRTDHSLHLQGFDPAQEQQETYYPPPPLRQSESDLNSPAPVSIYSVAVQGGNAGQAGKLDLDPLGPQRGSISPQSRGPQALNHSSAQWKGYMQDSGDARNPQAINQ